MTSTETTQEDPRLLSLKPFFDSCERNFKEYQSLAAQVAAADGDRDAAVQAWMDTTADAEATAIRDAIARATEKLRTLAEAAVGDTTISEEEKARLKTQLTEVEKKAKASSRSLRGLADPFGLDVTPMLAKLGDPFLPKTPTGTGSSAPRPSVYVECMRNGNPKQTMTFENLSGAAKHMDIPLEELGKLYAEAAGVPYEDIAKVKEPKEFEWTHGTNGNHWTIKTTPKENSRGRQAVVNTDTASTEQPSENDEAVA